MFNALRDESQWALPIVLEQQSRVKANAQFVSVIDEGSITYAALQEAAERIATFLTGFGVGVGDRVAVMLPNGLDFLRAWTGIGRLGAVMVALNTELVGAFLEHQIRDCEARLIIADAEFAERIEAAGAEPRIVVVRGIDVRGDRADFDRWRRCERYAGQLPRPSDLACIMYTSGTTGPAKGVLMPHAHVFLFGLGAIDNLGLGPEDHYYVTLPLYHANGLFMQVGAVLIAGASATLRGRFSASAWLGDVQASGATITNMLGATSAFIAALPCRGDEGEHRLRLVAAAPNHPEHEAMWRERFGVQDVLGLYGMTEVNIPLCGERGRSRPGTCGRTYARYFEVEIRNPETDAPVPTDQVGEIMVRPRVPFGFMAGYHRLPDKTLEAWRNFWFHTGDAGSMDEDGYVTFVDRIKDCIRRRGENISSFEVETVIAGLEGVEEAAAYAVPSGIDGGEDEIMIAVIADHARVTPERIREYARHRLPRYALPRFIEIVSVLPRTSTGKVRKQELRARGVGPSTWDGQSAVETRLLP